jgi:4-amino-4-deoxy-L-arabinose transferase-like glycosyltransferase
MIRRYAAELGSASTLLSVYLATLAPSVTLWDSGEFLAAIHSIGVPHPPGTPLYILIGKVWATMWAPIVGFAYSINMLSAVCTAFACALLANLFARWTGDRLAAYAGAVCAGTMSTVWLSANETEVYAVALLGACVLLWIGNEAGETGQRRWWFLGGYASGLAWALHLTALVTLPAALYLALAKRSLRDFLRSTPWIAAMVVIGASAVLFMLVRAPHDPWVNQGNPSEFSAFADVLLRRQYDVAPLWPRQAPVYIQLGNLIEYWDWQVALGLAPDPPPSLPRTAMTLLFTLLGIVGCVNHRRTDLRSWRAMWILFATATIGVIAYLNLKAGPSYGAGFLPANAPHEARERDYFFMLAFVCWGMWAGFGAVSLMRRAVSGRLQALGAVIALLPVFLNWSAVNRRGEPGASEARDAARRILASAPRSAIVLARGDNEAYPVWYMQEVERLRPDVTVIVVPLLPAQWYRAELERRHALLPRQLVTTWKGVGPSLVAICEKAAAMRRPVAHAGTGPEGRFPEVCETR